MKDLVYGESLLGRAVEFAKHKHKWQTRKFTGAPYFVHCATVACIVDCFENDWNNIQSRTVAYLHDTLEDTNTTYEELVSNFDSYTADCVKELTKTPEQYGMNRSSRLKVDIKRFYDACETSKTVKLADILDNVPSMFAFDPEYGMKYLKEKMLFLPALEGGNPELFDVVVNTLDKLLGEM
jgi:(p)ppGpp synthase/HD superfamily hydrolase